MDPRTHLGEKESFLKIKSATLCSQKMGGWRDGGVSLASSLLTSGSLLLFKEEMKND